MSESNISQQQSPKETNNNEINISNYSTTTLIEHKTQLQTELQHIFTILMFVTRIPIPLKYQEINIHPKYVMTGMCYFPLVGFGIGVLTSTVYEFCEMVFPKEVCCLICMIFHFWVCNCFHEDGLADTFDGMGGGWSKEQILTIMSDSRIGTYGSVSLITFILAKFHLLLLFNAQTTKQALIVSQMYARVTAPILIYSKSYVKEAGVKTSTEYYHYMIHASRYNTLGRVLYSIVLCTGIGYFILDDFVFCIVLVGVVLIVSYIAGFYGDARLGGIMGDYLGCTIALTELLLLLVLIMKNDIMNIIPACHDSTLSTLIQKIHVLYDTKPLMRCSSIILLLISWFNLVGYTNKSPLPSATTNQDEKSHEGDKYSLHSQKNNFQSRYEKAKEFMDSLAKPPGSLGTLQEWAVRVAAIQGTLQPKLTNIQCMIFAADHGVAAPISKNGSECSSYPQSITKSILTCLENGTAVSSVLCSDDVTLRVVDVGVVDYSAKDGTCVISAKDKLNGTRNFCRGDAMTREEVQKCYTIGREYVKKLNDTNVVVFGEVGIGNTTTSSVLLSFLTNKTEYEDICKLVGPGATTTSDEINKATIQKKIKIVQEAIALHYKPHANTEEIWNILQKVGGAEIISIIGAIHQASHQNQCILLDGFIVTVAALAAIKLNPEISPFLFLTTQSSEPGHSFAIECMQEVVIKNGYPALGRPVLDMGLRLGEGTGGVLAVGLLRNCVKLFHGVATLEQVLKGDNSEG